MGGNSSKSAGLGNGPRQQPQTQDSFLRRNNKALLAAAKAGDHEQVEQLLQPLVAAVTAEMAVPDVYPGPAAAVLSRAVGYRDRHHRTPFLTACLHGSWECAELLLEAGSNILAADAEGNGCLHLASINGHGHVVNQLLAKADVQGISGRLVNTVNRSSFSPLHYAAWGGHAHIIHKLLVSSSFSDRIMLLACTDDYDRWLVVSKGATALHVAALQQHASVVLAILQHYALLLRDWLPVDSSSRRPVDPRSWPDAQGATPLHVALWRGLDPRSQLATLLHPRTDVSTLFSLQQLEELRRRGAPTLQVLAATTLRSTLLRQLQQQQTLLQEQHQIEALQARRQQQRLRQQDNKQQRQQIWQRWWGQDAAPAPAGTADSSTMGAAATAAVYSSGKACARVKNNWESPVSGTAVEVIHELFPWSDLRRTPSITLGAMQQYGAAAAQQQDIGSNQADNVLQQKQNQQPGSSISWMHQPIDRAVAALLSAPQHSSSDQPRGLNIAGADCNLVATETMPAAQAGTDVLQAVPSAAAKVDSAVGVQQLLGREEADVAGSSSTQQQHGQQLTSASSITLGCLDRIWLVTEQQQQQQQLGQDTAVDGPAPAVHHEPSTAGAQGVGSAHDGTVGSQSTAHCSSSSSSNAGRNAAAVSCKSCPLQHHPQGGSTSAVAAQAVPDALSEHLYKGVGSTSSFQLLGRLAACSTGKAQHSTLAPSSVHSSTTADLADDITCASLEQDIVAQQQMGLGDCAGSDAAAAQCDQHANRCATAESGKWATQMGNNAAAAGGMQLLATSSITLGQLASRQQQEVLQPLRQQQQEGWRHWQQQPAAEQQSLNEPGPVVDPGSSTSSGSPGTRQKQRPRRPLREAHKGKMHPLLATAGIKSTDWDQHLTPLAWKLLQQQHQEQHQVQRGEQQQSEAMVSGAFATAGSSAGKATGAASQQPQHQQTEVCPAAEKPVYKAQQQHQQHQRKMVQSPHRRSFEMYSSSASSSSIMMPGAFGARRHHVARMLAQASMRKDSLLDCAAAQGLHMQGLLSGSRRGSLDRAALTLDVATSLAGALPGCVSEKLGQYLQVYGAGGGLGGSSGSSSCSSSGVNSSRGCRSHDDAHSGRGSEPSGGGVVAASSSSGRVRRSLDLFKRGSSSKGVSGDVHGTETCAVCMDADCAVALSGCSHSLCFTCAGGIIGQGVGVRPPLCPFCRTAIRGVQLRVLQEMSM